MVGPLEQEHRAQAERVPTVKFRQHNDLAFSKIQVHLPLPSLTNTTNLFGSKFGLPTYNLGQD